jgi:hypothetical protein
VDGLYIYIAALDCFGPVMNNVAHCDRSRCPNVVIVHSAQEAPRPGNWVGHDKRCNPGKAWPIIQAGDSPSKRALELDQPERVGQPISPVLEPPKI